MRRTRNNVEILIWSISVISLALFLNNYLIYYLVILQCSWPTLQQSPTSQIPVDGPSISPVYAMVIADTHLLGSKRGHWLDKLQREWQMYRSFQTAISVHRPNVVFVLGDLFDEGQWCGAEEFSYYISRFHKLFAVPEGTVMHVVAGNHDIGFHYWISPYLQRRFASAFNIPLVQLLNINNNSFVLINSMAMEGDKCSFCSAAERQLKVIAGKLNCLKGIGESCKDNQDQRYSRPIVLQHFPLYRPSDTMCNEPDEAPEDVKNLKFREKWECLSQEATEKIFDILDPRLVLGGHTHHGCRRVHRQDIIEYSIASFSWRNRPVPSFALLTVTQQDFAVSKCYLPDERTVFCIYSFAVVVLILRIIYLVFLNKFRWIDRWKIYIHLKRRIYALQRE